jgi:mRNA interferase RelE/StbE
LAWTIRFDPRAAKDLARLDRSIQRKILHYLETRVAPVEDPESLGKALSGDLSGLWRYRVEDHRIVCRIHRDEILIVVLVVGHRKDVYA